MIREPSCWPVSSCWPPRFSPAMRRRGGRPESIPWRLCGKSRHVPSCCNEGSKCSDLLWRGLGFARVSPVLAHSDGRLAGQVDQRRFVKRGRPPSGDRDQVDRSTRHRPVHPSAGTLTERRPAKWIRSVSGNAVFCPQRRLRRILTCSKLGNSAHRGRALYSGRTPC